MIIIREEVDSLCITHSTALAALRMKTRKGTEMRNQSQTKKKTIIRLAYALAIISSLLRLDGISDIVIQQVCRMVG